MFIAVVNLSTVVSDEDADTMSRAAASQLKNHVAPRYDRRAPKVGFYPGGQDAKIPSAAFPLFLLDNSDQAGALGYHAETPQGKPYGKVFAEPVLENGGNALTASLSVASVLSHEAIEAFGDVCANDWADQGDEMYAYELADAVEGDSYAVPVAGVQVTVSNFVLPAWFDPLATAGPFDYLAKLDGPFKMTPGGYVIIMKAGTVTQRFGAEFPAWKKDAKRHPAARTSRRLHGPHR